MDYSTGKDIRRMVAVQVRQGALVRCAVLCGDVLRQQCFMGRMLFRCNLSSSARCSLLPNIWLLQEVVDIEESIWSTKFGVKGMIDIRWVGGAGGCSAG
jgi:hypothetical protein